MRRVAAGLLTACLLMASAGATMAQEPSSSPEPAGQRVEFPEAGFALTFPADWEIDVDIDWTEDVAFSTDYLLTDGEVHGCVLCRGS
ncbi:MAG: hypothetical protein U9O18_00625 [Chloroflexota bacterium]|nr:hypothetical protein [Chloroflexota bacterium]